MVWNFPKTSISFSFPLPALSLPCRDGPDQNSPQIGQFSGNTALESVYSTSNQILIKFHSDFTTSGFFVLSYHGKYHLGISVWFGNVWNCHGKIEYNIYLASDWKGIKIRQFFFFGHFKYFYLQTMTSSKCLGTLKCEQMEIKNKSVANYPSRK